MSDFPPATLVLPSYWRIHNIRQILEAAIASGVVSEILIWNNSDDHAHDRLERIADNVAGSSEGVRIAVLKSEFRRRNLYLYGRFLAAQQATNDVILTCDDDNLVGNWADIVRAFLYHECREIVAAIPSHHRSHIESDWKIEVGSSTAYEVLLGWGAAFGQQHLELFFGFVEQSGGEPELLWHRKADRLFSLLQHQPHVIVDAAYEELPGSRDGDALYRRPDHEQLTRSARQLARHLLEGGA